MRNHPNARIKHGLKSKSGRVHSERHTHTINGLRRRLEEINENVACISECERVDVFSFFSRWANISKSGCQYSCEKKYRHASCEILWDVPRVAMRLTSIGRIHDEILEMQYKADKNCNVCSRRWCNSPAHESIYWRFEMCAREYWS